MIGLSPHAKLWRRRPRAKKAKATPIRDAGIRFRRCGSCGQLFVKGEKCAMCAEGGK